jgi:hypothetical protein
MLTAIRRAWPLVAVALLTLALTAAGSQAANGGKGKRPADVVTKTDAAKGKLDTKLQAKVESGETQAVPIFASLTGDVAAAKSLVQNAKVAQHEGFALLVGSIPTQLTPKLASLDGVISVGLVEFKQTGEPTGWQDPDLAGGHDPNTRRGTRRSRAPRSRCRSSSTSSSRGAGSRSRAARLSRRAAR